MYGRFLHKHPVIKKIISSLTAFVLSVTLIFFQIPFISVVNSAEASDEGLISKWSAEGNANDSIGTNDGTLMGDTTYASGRVGQAFSFDGTGDYVDAGTSNDFNFNNGAGNFTIDAWINLTAHRPNTMFNASSILNKLTLNPFSGWGLYIYPDGKLAFGGVGVWEFVSAAGTITTGNWAHVAVAKQGNAYRMYKNGLEIASSTYGNLQTSSAPLKIGSNSNAVNANGDLSDNRFNGLIDEVKIYNRALTDQEINNIYTAPFTLNLANGSIVIKDGAYTIGGGEDIANPDNVYIITQTDPGTPTANTITIQDGVTASIAATFNGVNISGGNPVNLGSSGNLTLALAEGVTNTLQGGLNAAGVRIVPGTNLTINGTGTLNTSGGGNYGAGIGGNGHESAGTLTVDGGIINAYGTLGSGIGGGGTRLSGDYADGMNGGTVTINSGTVYAAGETGIGGSSTYRGVPGAGGNFTITGGSVTALGVNGIGAGTQRRDDWSGTPAVVKIDEGADVKAYASGYSYYIGASIDDPTIESSNGTNAAATLFQGNFTDRPDSANPREIEVSSGGSLVTTLTLPADYRGFATTVPLGGTYRASIPSMSKLIAKSDNNTDFSIIDNQINSFTGLILKTPYDVTYNGNGNTGGSIPTDSNLYDEGSTVTVLGNSGTLEKTGYVFSGWNTQSDGNGTDYNDGSTFTMGTANVTLYAKWEREDGLISYWPADGNADDAIGANNGTLMNGATYAPGVVGQAFSFDGVNDYIDIPHSPSLNLTNGLTLEAWFNLRSSDGNSSIFSKADYYGSESLTSYGLAATPGGGLHVALYGTYPADWWATGDGLIETNQWNHVALTWDGTYGPANNVSLYLNGSFVQSWTKSFTPLNITEQSLTLGSMKPPAYYNRMNGLIDEAKIYNRALSADEITGLYDFTAPSVESVTPANDSIDIPIDTTISATFSEDMDESMINTSSFTVSNTNGNIDGTVTYDEENRTATFTPSTNLSYNTTYTASISTAVKDLAGNSLSSDYAWSFTTELPPWDGPGVYMSRASVDADGQEANGYNMVPSISSNGRYIAFYSDASNLVSDDTNNKGDIFRKDLQTGEIIRVSTDSSGNEANDGSWYSSISSNGRYVVFDSRASNLVSDDTNGQWDIFRKDLQTGTTVRVSTDSLGNQANSGSDWASSISSDGRYVAFSSAANNLVAGDTNSKNDIFRKDLQTGEIEIVSTDQSDSQADAASWDPSMSADGRYVAFHSGAANLVSGDTNGTGDIFRKDMETKEIVRATTDSLGNQAYGYSDSPSISSDGRYIVFFSGASNLVSGDTNAKKDIFRKDLETGQTVRVNVDSVGNQANDESNYSSISSDGRYVVFDTKASNLIPNDSNNDWDVYRKDMQTDEITRINVNSLGYQSDFSSKYTEKAPTISSDGRFIVFDSIASDMVSGDSNIKYDIFFADMSLYPQITDNTPPTTSYTLEPSEANNGWFNITPTVTLTSTEDGNTYYSWTSTPNYKYMYPIAAPEGEKTLYYYSTDLFGNRETGKTTSINVDLTPPSLDFGSEYPDLSFVCGDLTFNPAVSDNLSGLSVTNFYVNESFTVASLDASPSFNLNTLTLPDGNLTIKAETIDNAGNTSVVERTYIVDNTKPAVNAGTDKKARTAFTQSASASDVYGIATYQWSQQSGPGTVSFSEPASPTTSIGATADGNYTIRLTATDNAGNESYDEFTLIWDTKAPSTSKTLSKSANAKGWHKANVNLTLKASDGTSGVNKTYYRIGSSGSFLTYSGPVALTFEGVKTIYYYSTDKATNKETTKSVTVRIDKSKPTIASATMASTTLSKGGKTKAKFKVGDNLSPKIITTLKIIKKTSTGEEVKSTYSLGEKNKNTLYEKSITAPTKAGTYYLRFVFKDYAGNQTVKNIKFTVK